MTKKIVQIGSKNVDPNFTPDKELEKLHNLQENTHLLFSDYLQYAKFFQAKAPENHLQAYGIFYKKLITALCDAIKTKPIAKLTLDLQCSTEKAIEQLAKAIQSNESIT